jgi:hypothetical protein
VPGIDECLREVMSLPGALGAALVDWTSGLALGTAGRSPVGDHETTAAETAELARAAAEYESFAPDAAPAALPPAPGPAADPAGGPPRDAGTAVAGGLIPGAAAGSRLIPRAGSGPGSGLIPDLTPVPAPGLTARPAHGSAAPEGRDRPGGAPAGTHAADPPAPSPQGAAPTGSPASAAPSALPALGTLPVGVDPEAPPVEDVIVTTRTGYHVLRFVETTFDSSVFLHLWLDRSTGNLALARLRMRELAERLVLV